MRVFKVTYTYMLFGDSFEYVVAESFEEVLTLFKHPKIVSISVDSHNEHVIMSKTLAYHDGA